MTVVRLKGVKRYRHPKTGIEYCYHRASGTRLKEPVGSPAFFAELARAEAAMEGRAVKPKAGTLGALMTEYRSSHLFLELKVRARADYEGVMTDLGALDGLPLGDIDGPFVARLRDKVYSKKKRRFANYCLAVLSVLLEFGRERGVVKFNAVRGIKKVRRRNDERTVNRPWTRAEREVVQSAASAQVLLPIALARWTGMRQGDILRMRPTAYDGSTIRLRTSKRGVQVNIPVAAPPKAILDAVMSEAEKPDKNGNPRPRPITLCSNAWGKPWTSSGYRASFFKLIRGLEERGEVGGGLTFHGLRHSVATELRELGFDSRTIADMLGQKTVAMAEHYSSEADLSARLKGVVRKPERANAKRTKLSTSTVYTREAEKALS